jgi:hypothetical protein
MAEKVDPEVSKLEVDALNEYFAGEAKNIELTKNNYLPPNLQDLDLNDPRITAAPFELQPFTTEEGMKARGILDAKGEATQLGEDYLLLEERGLFKDGELTEKGIAFTSENEIYDTVNFVEKNMDASQFAEKARRHSIREEAGLTKESMVSEDGMLADFWNGIKGLATGADTILRGTIPNARDLAKNRISKDASLLEAASDMMASGKSKEEVTTARAEAASKFVGGSSTGLVKGAELLQNLGANVGEALGLYSPEEAKAGKEQASYKTEMFKRTYAGIDAAEFASQVGLAEEVGNAVFETKKQYDAQYGEKGADEFQKALNNYGSVGTVAGDPIALAIGGGVGTAIGLVKYANAARNATKIAQGMAAVNRGQLLVKEQAKLSSVASGLQKESAVIQGQLDDALKIGATEKATELTTRLDGVTASTRELGSRLTTINEGIANASTFANKVEIGLDSARTVQDVIRGAGAATMGKTASVLDSIGNKAASLNGFVKVIERKMGITKIPWLVRVLASVPYSQVAIPYLGARIGIAVAPKVLKNVSKFASVMSEEMIERTSSTPFFRRVAANERIGGLGGALATIADYSSPLARGFARATVGTAIAAPATLAYNAINSKGVDEETLALAGRDALVFGGLGRLVGGRKDFSQTKIDEMVNYRNKLTPENLAIYDGIKDRGMRTFVSSLDAAYPGFFEWEFRNSGNNLFDPASRKAVVNLNDRAGFLKAVAAHEVGHMIQFRHNNNEMIVSRMLGILDNKSGLVRNMDGTLDPEFKAWGDEYNNLRRDNDIAPAGLEELAIEFYTDNGVRALVEDVSSGKLFQQSRKTPLRRSIENSFTNLFASAPIVKNLHFKFGGATDAGGRMVMGTGLLADGMRELPEVKEMLRQAYKDTAGKPLKQVNNRVPDVKSTNPSHYEARETINTTNKKIVDAGEKLPENVMVVNSNGNGRGQLSIDHFKDLEERKVIDNGTFSMAAMLQERIDSQNKFAISLVNKPIEQGRSVQIEGLTENLVVPTGWLSRNGRLYLEAMDLKQLEINLQRAVKNPIAKKLKLNRNQILDDIQESVAIQNKGQSTDAYYKSKDPKNWERRKNFINSVLGLQTKKQLTINPLMSKVSPDLESGIFRTFAFDRLQSAIQTNSNVSIPFGANSYYAIRDNLLPQSPRFNRNGELVPEKSNVSFMPTGKPKGKPTRLAEELAKKAKIPLSKVNGSGANGTITPNDIRAYIESQGKKFKPLAFQKEPPMAVDPTISDLVGSEVKFENQVGVIIDDGGRPAFQGEGGIIYELPFSYFTDESSRQLGVKPTGKRVVDKNNLIKEFEGNSRQELREIFGYIDDITDNIVGFAELGNSIRRNKGRKSELVRETQEFQQYVRGVTDQQILHSWDRTEKALNRAKQSKNINDENIKAIIDKLKGDIRNIEKLSEAIDVFKQQRISRPSISQESTTAVSGTSKADLMAEMEIEARKIDIEAKAETAKRKAASVVIPKQTSRTSRTVDADQQIKQKYNNPALARSISLAISGASTNKEK